LGRGLVLLFNAPVPDHGQFTPPPTRFADLNELLEEFVDRVASILRGNFVGVYLTGSFALGAGDLHSDCDFLVVTVDRVTAEQESSLR
jgi:predicted nucleotidyltransferase